MSNVSQYYQNSGAGGISGGSQSLGSYTDAARSFTPDPALMAQAQDAYNKFSGGIDSLNNQGAGRRLEVGMGMAQNQAQQAAARAGLDPNSLQGAQLMTNAGTQAATGIIGEEADREAQLRQVRAGMYGQLANTALGMQAQQAQQQFTMEDQRLQRQQYNWQRMVGDQQMQLAMRQQALQEISNPMWRWYYGASYGITPNQQMHSSNIPGQL